MDDDLFVDIASFDIGFKNFAFCVERINLQKLKEVENVSKTKRYTVDGIATSEFKKILDEISKETEENINSILLDSDWEWTKQRC